MFVPQAHNHQMLRDPLPVPAGKEQSQALSEEQKAKIKSLLIQHDAALIAHYYTAPALQALAEETGGCVADSLEMARFGTRHNASTLVVCGVKFMAETAKILNPEKRVLALDLQATCSLDTGCPAGAFAAFCDAHPHRTVVVYANTSAAVKARADWVVTSSSAVEIVESLCEQDKPLIWAPDKYLGQYVQKRTGADMLIWNGACVVHEEFKAQGIRDLRQVYPDAVVLVHPESPEAVIDEADITGSTSQLIEAARRSGAKTFIVATERGIFYKMHQVLGPSVTLLEAPTAGNGATCKSCARCPWMAMNTPEKLSGTLQYGHNEVQVDPAIREKALIPLQRMLEFTAAGRVAGAGSAGTQRTEPESATVTPVQQIAGAG